MASIDKIQTLTTQNGFTLIELIVVIVVLGILVVVATPRFIDIGADARTANVKTMASTINTVANLVFYKCQVNPDCNPKQNSQAVTMDGIGYQVSYGYPDAGNSVNNNQIDTLFDHKGYTVTIDGHSRTYFRFTKAPDPENCSVTYIDAYDFANDPKVTIMIETSGC